MKHPSAGPPRVPPTTLPITPPSTPQLGAPSALPWAWLGLAGLGAAAWQGLALSRALLHGRHLARMAEPFATHPPRAQARVLLLGDSTGVGVGSGSALQSLPGLLAAEFPRVEIVNACSHGARVADTLTQLRAHTRAGQAFDLALVLAGGNDVLRFTPPRPLALQAEALLRELQPQARNIVWLGGADIGTAPALKPPLNWAFGWLCRSTMRLLDRTVNGAGVEFIDFSGVGHSRVFAAQPGRYFAGDGLHSSSASYRHCFDELKRRAPLVALLKRRPVCVAANGPLRPRPSGPGFRGVASQPGQ